MSAELKPIRNCSLPMRIAERCGLRSPARTDWRRLGRCAEQGAEKKWTFPDPHGIITFGTSLFPAARRPEQVSKQPEVKPASEGGTKLPADGAISQRHRKSITLNHFRMVYRKFPDEIPTFMSKIARRARNRL